MDLVQAIEAILDQKLLHTGPLRLTEEDPDSKCQPITLRRTGRAVAIRPSQLPSPLFNTDAAGLTRLCDYIVFYRTPSNRNYVFLCELKSGGNLGAEAQVANGRLLSDYIVAMARRHCPVTESTDSLRYRALIFSAVHRNPKGSLRPGKFKYTRSVTDMPDIRVAYLGCGTELQLPILCDD